MGQIDTNNDSLGYFVLVERTIHGIFFAKTAQNMTGTYIALLAIKTAVLKTLAWLIHTDEPG